MVRSVGLTAGSAGGDSVRGDDSAGVSRDVVSFRIALMLEVMASRLKMKRPKIKMIKTNQNKIAQEADDFPEDPEGFFLLAELFVVFTGPFAPRPFWTATDQ